VVARIITEPLAWVAAESATLLAVLDLAARLDLQHAAAALVVSLRVPLVRLDLLGHCAKAAARLDELVTADQETKACAALASATSALHRGRYPEVLRILTENRTELASVDPALRADILAKLGDAKERCRDASGAMAAFREAARWYRASGNGREEAACHASMSNLYRNEFNDPRSAVRHAHAAVRLADPYGDWKIMAQTRVALAHAYLDTGDPAASRPFAEQALTIVTAHGDPVGQAWCQILTPTSPAPSASSTGPGLRPSARSSCPGRLAERTPKPRPWSRSPASTSPKEILPRLVPRRTGPSNCTSGSTAP
jgi:tetratricopeptide (TPR) repeat protein